MIGSPNPFFESPVVTFGLRDMIPGRSVHHFNIEIVGDRIQKGSEFLVAVHSGDTEPGLVIHAKSFIQSGEQGIRGAIHNGDGTSILDFAINAGKKGQPINKHKINAQMQIKVFNDRERRAPGRFPLQASKIGTEDAFSEVNVAHGNRTVLEYILANDVLEIFAQ